ncbi:hypothetical protein P154DRAFT_594844 [Amniculicola lignicola CBS 123094]|uniref:SET domain-containing protein n=1 Tax=Amniculicola lignicola CBS 123094 TaxID=1392246 RepID=A0A6A5W0V1_9PLEO|nr:hypothetical protein P154DRAFT_594844 [Amniculicola lignicola CBS 123094]
MDVDTDLREFFGMINRQKQVLLDAKSRKGECPRDRKSRDEMYLRFVVGCMASSAKRQEPQENMIHSSFMPAAYPPCTSSVSSLQSIMIKDLCLEIHHRGKLLLLRAITPPDRLTGIICLVEDEDEGVATLQIYQQDEETVRKATQIVDVGTILLVKEPYFKTMANGEYGLRVDHLSDLVEVDEDAAIVPQTWRLRRSGKGISADSLKLEGNAAIGQGDCWLAIKKYTNALKQQPTQQEAEIIKRNRSLALLRTGQYDAALSNSGFPSFGFSPPEKSLFRASEALYHLGKFAECCQVLEQLCVKYPANSEAPTSLARARRRLAEHSNGNIDFASLQTRAKRLYPPRMDHATYLGPVEIRDTNDLGRGVFVTKAVEAGELLFCEKAFSYAYVSEQYGRGNAGTKLLMNPETGRGFLGGQADLLQMIVQKLFKCPSIASSFTNLYHGSYMPIKAHEVDGESIVDTFLAERIISFNVFGCPHSSLQTHRDTMANKGSNKHKQHSCGIWTTASYINHSCLNNCHRTFIGDIMIVRATKDLNVNTELRFCYQLPTGKEDIGEHQETLQKGWEFTCTCTLCKSLEETPTSTFATRRKLFTQLSRICAGHTMNSIPMRKVERLLKSLSETYDRPASEVPRLALWDPQLMLARIYLAKKEHVKTLDALGKTLEALGFVCVGLEAALSTRFRVVKWGSLIDHVVEMFRSAHAAFRALGAIEDASIADGYARTAYRILVGEDSSYEATVAGYPVVG